ncbi:MAG TPA: methyltransferase domain-containing protein, partial [Bacteroidales bacterium]|nr:methyltransferase domain-containing protein [Bacteroidales bacterium]
IGETGKVIAADISQQMLDLLIHEFPVSDNIQTLLCEKNNISLPDNSVDKILMAFVLHEVDDAVAYLKMLRNILKGNGKLFIVEWTPVESTMGPPLHERLSKETIEKYFSDAGFEMLRFENVNDFQYFCEAQKII